MKTLKTKYFIVISIAIVFLATIILYATETGRTGRTLKTSTLGCGSCHGSTFTSNVLVVVTGPDTVHTGQTVQYSLSVSKPTKTGAGLDIAVRKGSLSPVSSNIHLAGGELTHNSNIPMTSGTATVQFNYIAPALSATDSIWATGLATNSDGSESDDDWNWASTKKVVVLPPSTINISVIPQGFYNTSSNVLNRRDTVRAYLRNISSPFSIVDSSKAIVDSVSFQGGFNFINALGGTYYIVIKHRNSIETWSRSGGEPFIAGTVMSYTFANAASKAFGNNMIQVSSAPVRFGIYSGDVNQDGTIDLTDIINIYNDAGNFVSGYVNTDVTGDNFVDLSDVLIAYNNSANFVSIIRP